MNNIRSTLSSFREYLTPVTHTSTFKSTGEITPEEFVAAGDYLAYKFPTWQWSPAPKDSLQKSFLPADKQFLVTKKVPSYQRALSYLAGTENGETEEDVVDEDGWTTTHVTKKKVAATNNSEKQDDLIASKQEPQQEQQLQKLQPQQPNELVNDQEIQDIDDDDFDIEPVDKQTGATENGIQGSGNKEEQRNYDLYITYSTSYRVPKMYLVGFDDNGIPLTPDQMFEDISADYRDKTATIEKAPFLVNTTSVSIHPCRHATVMKILMNRAQIAAQNKKLQKASKEKDIVTEGISKLGLKDSEAGDNLNNKDDDEWENIEDDADNDNEEVLRVDQYLVIFLKFIASVTPGINHDYTMDAF